MMMSAMFGIIICILAGIMEIHGGMWRLLKSLGKLASLNNTSQRYYPSFSSDIAAFLVSFKPNPVSGTTTES